MVHGYAKSQTCVFTSDKDRRKAEITSALDNSSHLSSTLVSTLSSRGLWLDLISQEGFDLLGIFIKLCHSVSQLTTISSGGMVTVGKT